MSNHNYNTNKSMRIIQYLGSKVKILDDIEQEIDKLASPGDTVADVFAGTGVVSNALKRKYHVISNDIQEYSYLMNCLLLKVKRDDIKNSCSINKLFESRAYKKNLRELMKIFRKPLELEEQALVNRDTPTVIKLNEANYFYDGSAVCSSSYEVQEAYKSVEGYFTAKNIEAYRSDFTRFPYMLFTLYYQNSYFGLRQCIEIDSLRYAIDQLSNTNYKDDKQKQILLVCLLHAISEVVSSVGKHFAQPIKLRDRNGDEKEFSINRYLRDRERSIKTHMERMYEDIQENLLEPHYDNQVYNLDYKCLIGIMKKNKVKVAYLDPPYTIDHYSRFYHIPETLIKYDYPILEYKSYKGKRVLMQGRYRADRFQSEFCISSKAKEEFDKMLYSLSKIECNIVLSYSGTDKSAKTRKRVIEIDEICRIAQSYYKEVSVKRIEHRYRKLNEKHRNKEEAMDNEVLIICK